MAVPFSNTKLRVPKGFQNILEGLAREILRSQPKDMFDFGAIYFENLLKVRDETGHDPALHGAKLDDRFYNNDSFKNSEADTRPASQPAIVQQEKKAVEEEEVDIDLNDPEVADAAAKIQAGFRGFQARKEVQAKDPQEESGKVTVDLELTEQADMAELLSDPDAEAAAVKIQSAYRKHTKTSSHDNVEVGVKVEAGENVEPGTSGEVGEAPKPEVSGEAEVPKAEASGEAEAKVETEAAKTSEEANVEDEIDLEDPEIVAATAKIQAAYMKRQLKKPAKK